MLKKLRANLPKYKKLLGFYLSTAIDRVLFNFGPNSSKLRWEKEAKHILFFTEDPRIDIIRFCTALKSHMGDFRFSILLPHSGLDNLFQIDTFDQVIYYRNLWDFRRKLNQFEAIRLAHGFTRRCHTVKILIEEYKLPVFINVKDTSVASHGLNPPHWYLREELPSEKSAFSFSNGILAESLEPNHASRLFQIKKRPASIYFPNYCESNKNLSLAKKISETEWHFVYVGSIRGSQDNALEHGNIQMHWLIKTLNDQKIHFHVYPNPNMSRVVYDEYYAMERELAYFHMHESLSPEKLNREISQYHYGLIPFFNEDTNRSPLKRYYSSSLKIFNYVEAGLPVLISKDMGHQRWILERYGMAIGLHKSDFYAIEEKIDFVSYKKQVNSLMENRKNLTLENQIHRVSKFYRQILNDFKQ